jgi:hypothetical protein
VKRRRSSNGYGDEAIQLRAKRANKKRSIRGWLGAFLQLACRRAAGLLRFARNDDAARVGLFDN